MFFLFYSVVKLFKYFCTIIVLKYKGGKYMYLMISILALLIAFFIAIIKPEYRKLLIIVNIFICIIYIIWRFTAIPIDHDIISFILGISLYCAEILGLISFINFQYLFSKNYKIENKSLNNYAP